MNISTHRFNHGLVFILGLILIIAGIVTSTEGAWIAGLLDCWIAGLIVAAVNLQQ